MPVPSAEPDHALLDCREPGDVAVKESTDRVPIYTPVGQINKQTLLLGLRRDAQQDLMLESPLTAF